MIESSILYEIVGIVNFISPSVFATIYLFYFIRFPGCLYSPVKSDAYSLGRKRRKKCIVPAAFIWLETEILCSFFVGVVGAFLY